MQSLGALERGAGGARTKLSSMWKALPSLWGELSALEAGRPAFLWEEAWKVTHSLMLLAVGREEPGGM